MSAKKTIALPDQMYNDALARAKRMKYSSFSGYVQYLIEKDLADLDEHKREDPEAKKHRPPDEKGG